MNDLSQTDAAAEGGAARGTAKSGPTRRKLADAIRALAMDAVQKAGNGHPGMPMGMADIAEVLWNDYMRHNPANPEWPDRDRFVVSNGHGSMLLYSVLHLTGYPLPMEELKNYRQWGSKTPGHPENLLTPGVETTTGPLGQGVGNAVGMALAERELANEFNRPGHKIVDHYTYVFAGDGCMMEGISHEAGSLAGTLGLGKLILFYDDNGISIDGEVEGWFTDDTPKRFESYGWHTQVIDGNDPAAIARAIEAARAVTERPSFIDCRTVIGYGAPHKSGTEEAHGAALGEEEVAAARKTLGWEAAPFVIPDEIRSAWDARERGAALEAEWNQRLADYARTYPNEAAEFKRRLARELPANFASLIKQASSAEEAGKASATRKQSGRVLEALANDLPELLGGSADLSGSNSTLWKGAPIIGRTRWGSGEHGRYLHYGVREFGMATIMSGISLHRGYRPYGGTFLTFSDYMRNAIRLAALMDEPVIYVFTHDSIGLGEDGPTHQPIEHLASLRAIPHLVVYRPADGVETAIGWQIALESHDHPTALILTRQATAALGQTETIAAGAGRGAYVLSEPPDGRCDGILLASGSEVGLIVEAQRLLADEGHAVRVVSMPSWELFEAQDEAYRESVLPAAVTRRVAVEAAAMLGWERYVGYRGRALGIDNRFGASAPGKVVFEKLGFTPEAVAEAYKTLQTSD
jgi:transketolase